MSVEEISILVNQKQLLEAQLREVNKDLGKSKVILERINKISGKIKELEAKLR